MIVAAFFSWWYGQGWSLVVKNARKRLHQTVQMFSVVALLQTLFSPWRRIVSNPGAGINAHIQAFLDNLVSRAVGFVVRIFVLLAALVAVVGIVLVNAIEIIAWPLIPLAVVAGIVWGVK